MPSGIVVYIFIVFHWILAHDAALIVYISLLEQQGKYDDALEVLSGKLGTLILIDVDRLRLQVTFQISIYFFSTLSSIMQE